MTLFPFNEDFSLPHCSITVLLIRLSSAKTYLKALSSSYFVFQEVREAKY